MSVRHTLSMLAALACLAPAGTALAQKLDKDQKKWLEDVKPILLPEEEKTYRELKDKAERDEFQKIFWARRDPDLATPENEYEAEYRTARAQADTLYRVDRPGAETDCGRVFLLLGKPDSVQQETSASAALRRPETWIYKNRPGQTFEGGQAQIHFEDNCMLPQGDRMSAPLLQLAESKIRHRNLGYPKDAAGKLVKLADQLPKPSPTQTLLDTPRQDFPLSIEPKLSIRPQGGGTYVAFLVRAPAGAVNPAKVVIAGRAKGASGALVPAIDRELTGSGEPDGTFVAAVGFFLEPGKHEVQVALFDPAAKKGSVATAAADVPDPAGTDVIISTLVAREVRDADKPLPNDPYFAVTGGTVLIIPRFGNAFSPAESPTFIPYVSGGMKDPATGKVALVLSTVISKNGTGKAKAPEQKIEETPMAPTIGPVPLAGYEPGAYVVEFKVRDEVAKKDFTEKVPFEVVAAK